MKKWSRFGLTLRGYQRRPGLHPFLLILEAPPWQTQSRPVEDAWYYPPCPLSHPGMGASREPRSAVAKVQGAAGCLMSAVILASSRVTSPSIAAAYLTHMKSYMEGIKKLFPQYRFRPNHHMALHLHEYLCRFGPVRSWWTFPFERIIGVLQCIPTNFKIGMSCALFLYLLTNHLIHVFHPGQLEQTISESFTWSANLRAFIYKTKQCLLQSLLVNPSSAASLTHVFEIH